jgi:hypothetical protein
MCVQKKTSTRVLTKELIDCSIALTLRLTLTSSTPATTPCLAKAPLVRWFGYRTKSPF